MQQSQRRSRGTLLRQVFIGIAFLVMLWGTLSPLYLMHAYRPSYAQLGIQSSRPGEEGVSRRLSPGSVPGTTLAPVTVSGGVPGVDRVWTLADHAGHVPGDWYERARLIVERNKGYLRAAEGRATRHASNFTLVSGMFDLGRGELGNDFKRSFDQYIQRFSTFLRYKFPIIIYIQEEHLPAYQQYLDQRGDLPTHIEFKTLDDIRAFQYYDEVQAIRTQKEWANQAGWLAKSPQATMELYNPMVMSKILWTRDAARLNPFNTDAFLWIDGGHQCNDPEGINDENAQLFKEHFDKLLITYFDYEPVDEIHGFKKRAFWDFIGNQDFIVRVGRGGIFGGTREYLEVASEVYLQALGATLEAGFMGTEENIFAILYYRFPELVHDFDNGEGGNCAIFYNLVHRLGPAPYTRKAVDFEIIDGWDLRGLTCEEGERPRCYDPEGRECPAYVTPRYLTMAPGQWGCQQVGSAYCTVDCIGEDLFWYAHDCTERPLMHCPPWQRVPFSQLTAFADPMSDEEKEAVSIVAVARRLPAYAGQLTPALSLPAPAGDVAVAPAHVVTATSDDEDDGATYVRPPPYTLPALTASERSFSEEAKRRLPEEDRNYLQRYGYDLRGLVCEIRDNREVCFLENPTGPRDECPEYVTSAYLALAGDQWSCKRENGKQTFCTAICQDGSDMIAWTAYDAVWCKENKEHCRPRPPVVPFADFGMQSWSQAPFPPKACDSRAVREFAELPKFTLAVLVRGNEVPTLRLSLNSWQEEGFLQFVDEVLIYVNERGREMDAFLEPYTPPPFNVRVLGDQNNIGILLALNELFKAASHEHVLFLEKDFRLVESLPCALEQIDAGLRLIDAGKAHVVKYRSRYNAGRPNWADILFRGDEESVFERQPNLLCNFYHWIDEPHKRWPDQFSVCNEDPTFYCSTSEFCNWTNNPFIIKVSWWMREYYNRHPEIREPPEGFDLETWMNWDADAWNHRGWIIAQGDGMFKHADLNNLGVW